MSVHLGESPEEVELLASGTGPWRGMLEIIGAWRDDWADSGVRPGGVSRRPGVIDARTLVVHGVQFDDRALERLAAIGATLVTCPRSNQWVGVGSPPIERFYQSGRAVAVGTDSLASVEDLNLFSELKTMRWLAPGVPARENSRERHPGRRPRPGARCTSSVRSPRQARRDYRHRTAGRGG